MSDQDPSWTYWLPRVVRQYIEGSDTFYKVITNTSWLMLERLVSMTISFLVSVWVVRYLGPEQYGLYSYALSYAYLFGVFARLGLDNILVRELTRDRIDEGEILGTAFTLRLVAALVSLAIIAAIIFSVQDGWQTRLVVLTMSGRLVLKSSDVFDHWFQARIESKYPALVRSCALITRAGIQVAFILAGFPLIAFVWVAVGRIGLQTAGIFIAYWIRSTDRSWRFRVSTAKQMMKDAWPLIISGFSIALYMKVDQIMIEYMVGSKYVGVYATAVKISELWYFIPTIVASTIFPKIVETKESYSEKVYRERMQSLYDVMSMISYLIVVPLAITAHPVIDILFGSEFNESAVILEVHIWAFIFVSLGVIRGKWLIAENMTTFSMIAAGIGAIVNVTLNVLLIPESAGVGAAWATLFAQVTATYLTCFLLSKTRSRALPQMTRALYLPFRIRNAYSGIKKVLLS